MVKPIPLFAFVFAAYAATSIAPVPISARGRKKIGVARDKVAKMSPASSVAPIWRTLIERSADICVKVGVVGGAGAKRLELAIAGGPQDGVEEIWLSKIAETARGFTGAVSLSAGSRIKLGKKVAFESDHVLDWTLRLSARKPAAASDASDEHAGPARCESFPS